MGKKTLNSVPCAMHMGSIKGIFCQDESIDNIKKVPILVPANCNDGHKFVHLVCKHYAVLDYNVAEPVISTESERNSVNKVQKSFDNY